MTFDTFNLWYKRNPELIDSLQTWLFYNYAVAEKKFGQNVESRVEVADMTVYLLLFYLSSENDYKYSYTVSVTELSRILETKPDIVEKALTSLSKHHLIHYHNHDDEIHLTIEPISVNE